MQCSKPRLTARVLGCFSFYSPHGKLPCSNRLIAWSNPAISFWRPSIKYVSTFFATFDTPSPMSALFYNSPSSLSPQFLTPSHKKWGRTLWVTNLVFFVLNSCLTVISVEMGTCIFASKFRPRITQPF